MARPDLVDQARARLAAQAQKKLADRDARRAAPDPQYVNVAWHTDEDEEPAAPSESTVEHESAVASERTVTAERAAACESTVSGERAGPVESTEIHERAVLVESTAEAERAEIHERTAAPEPVRRESTIERAIGGERTENDERAASPERTEASERAVHAERTVVDERAGLRESTEMDERAVKRERTVEIERAEGQERTVSCERTDGLRLNLGCGPNPPPGWVNVDREEYGQGSIKVGDTPGWRGDLLIGLPYPDEMFDCVVSHHALQMIPYRDFARALAELRRVLRPDGVLRISVPDLRAAFDAWLAGDDRWFPVVDHAEKQPGGKLCAYSVWYSEARLVFTHGWLTEWCVRAGFRQVAVCAYQLSLLGPDVITELDALPPRPRESIYVEAMR